MKVETFFALLTVRMLNLQFSAEQSWNPDMVHLTNKKGNSIYVKKTDTDLDISVYKQTASCFNRVVRAHDMSEAVVDEIAESVKLKLKLKHDIKYKADVV